MGLGQHNTALLFTSDTCTTPLPHAHTPRFRSQTPSFSTLHTQQRSPVLLNTPVTHSCPPTHTHRLQNSPSDSYRIPPQKHTSTFSSWTLAGADLTLHKEPLTHQGPLPQQTVGPLLSPQIPTKGLHTPHTTQPSLNHRHPHPILHTLSSSDTHRSPGPKRVLLFIPDP